MRRTLVVLAVTTFLAMSISGCRLISGSAEAAAGRDVGEPDTHADITEDIDAMPPDGVTPR